MSRYTENTEQISDIKKNYKERRPYNVFVL